MTYLKSFLALIAGDIIDLIVIAIFIVTDFGFGNDEMPVTIALYVGLVIWFALKLKRN